MHCPKCGQHQISEETRFCSRCGLPLTGIALVVDNHGVVPVVQGKRSLSSNTERRRGIKQGLFIFLLSFLIVPITAILTLAADAEPFAVVIAALLFGVGGILRMAYAFLFQSDEFIDNSAAFQPTAAFAANPGANSLPASHGTPVADYRSPAGAWRDTNDLQKTPSSVVDHTTKLLERSEDQ